MNETPLAEALNQLMSAELAGARVAIDSLRQVEAGPQRARLERIHYGEADSCRRLRQCLRQLDVEPTREMGAFHAKAMAIEDLDERLAFVDRGQQWVIRKVEALLEDSLDPQIREQLQAVLVTHQENSRPEAD